MTHDPAAWGSATEPSPSLLGGGIDVKSAADAALEPMSYETATGRLDEIVRRLDSGEAGLRETLELCQEGRRLVEFCAGELDAVGRGLEELRLEDLVARLEAGRTGA